MLVLSVMELVVELEKLSKDDSSDGLENHGLRDQEE